MSFVYHRDVLPSGLRVVTVETPHLHSALIALYIRTGSRHETPETNGVSHFLEHMFFRGSQGYPDTVRMNAAVEEVGGNLNGVTTRDHGSYYTPLHPESLGIGIRIMGDMLTRPLLKDIEIERRIILEEMLDEVDETGNDIDVDNLSKMELFGTHPLGLKIAGSTTSVKSIQLEQIKEHFAKHYVIENVVLTATGKIKREQVLELAEKAFANMPHGQTSTETEPPPSPPGPWLKFVHHDEAQTDIRITFRTVPEEHPDFAPLQLLRRVLDDGLSSRLPFQVVERRGLAYSVSSTLEAYHDVGLFDIDAASAPEKSAEVLSAIFDVISEVHASGVTAEELARAKRRHKIFLDFAHDSPGELAGWFGGTDLFRIPESFDEMSTKLNRVTLEDVQRVARRYLNSANLGVVAVGQRKGLKTLEKAVSHPRGI